MRLEGQGEARPARELQGSGVSVVLNTANQAPLGSSAATSAGLGLLICLEFPTGLIVLLTRIP